MYDNYICFGTTSKEECTSNIDVYMYRIIGIDETGQLKLIKMTPIDNMKWYTDYTTDITWPNSLIYQNINGDSYLNNNIYMSNGWSSKIVDYDWKYGDNISENRTAYELYTIENSLTDTKKAKIGLLYGHDYYYAYQSEGLNCSYYGGIYNKCKSSWLHLSENSPSTTNGSEWTMSRIGVYSNDGYRIFYITSNDYGYFYYDKSTANRSIRLVFYLNVNELYISGEGTLDSPILLLV